jgi:alkylated DNA repair dioxygenase AlkB
LRSASKPTSNDRRLPCVPLRVGANQLEAGGEVLYHPSWLNPPEADHLFRCLLAELVLTLHEVNVFGTKRQPRLSEWYGTPEATYRYSGRTFTPKPPPEALSRLMVDVSQAVHRPLNGVLANLYRDGNDSMGAHADNEPELGPDPVIASLSFGAVRRFVMRPIRKGVAPARDILLGHGSLLVMRGAVQTGYKHELPKSKAVHGPRLNLTFRTILTSS